MAVFQPPGHATHAEALMHIWKTETVECLPDSRSGFDCGWDGREKLCVCDDLCKQKAFSWRHNVLCRTL